MAAIECTSQYKNNHQQQQYHHHHHHSNNNNNKDSHIAAVTTRLRSQSPTSSSSPALRHSATLVSSTAAGSVSAPAATTLKLISRLRTLTRTTLQATALTLFVLLLSSCIALASASVAVTTTHIESAAPRQPPLPLYTTQLGADESTQTTTPPDVSVQLGAFIAAAAAHGSSNRSSSSGDSFSSSTDPPYNVTLYAAAASSGSSSSRHFASFTTPAAVIGQTIGTNSVYDLFGAVFGNITAPPPSSPMEFTMPPVQAILISTILLSIIIGTVVGNVLVCIAVCMVRKLRRPCNYLLVSLALSDLCVAVLVMPMAMLYEVLEKWNFGPLLCDIWVSFDVLCCTASILNLCAISVDRYLAITKPLEYGVKRTPRRMTLCVALVWLAAACISLPPLLILGNEHIDEQGKPICAVCQNFAYQIYATLGSFYIPLAVMLFVYYQIFRAAHRIVLEEKRAQTHLQHALNGTGGNQPPGNTELGSGNGNGQRHSSYGNTSLTYSTCGVLSAHGGGSGGGVSGSSNLLSSPHQKKIRFQLAKEKKASTTLGIIMSAFTICWLPFFILALIRPFLESETTHVPQSLSSLFLWLGYANSLLNPIIYATLNRDFRKPFQAILYFRCSSLNTMMRENYYQDQYGEPPSQRVMLGDERHGARESFL